MLQPQPRPGVYAWDERDAGSIASNTPSYGGALFKAHSDISPVPPSAVPGMRTTARLAAAVMARIRFRPRIAANLRG